MARKGRARRFREARQLKQGYEDGLFAEGSGTLADVTVDRAERDEDEDDEAEGDLADDWDDDEEDGDDGLDWDPDRDR